MVKRRSSRRDNRKERGAGIQQLPFRPLSNPYAPLEILTPEQIQRIDQMAMRILEDLGLEFLNQDALALLRQHGASVDYDSHLVRLEPGLVREWIAKAPAHFRLHARNPEHSLTLGGRHINFAAVAGPPNVSDLDQGRRPGTYQDQCNLLRLVQALNIVHLSSAGPVEALDLPAETRHLDTYYAQISLTDKLWNARAIGRQRVSDAIDMLCIGREIDKEQLCREPGLLTVINVNSPRRVDSEMLAGLMEMTRHGQPCIITPFTLAGAMSPVTLAGALAQQTAEALAVIAFTQMVRPGAPVIFGGFTSNVDMKSGAPAFGTPEYVRAVLIGGQLARYYGLPYRSSNVNASNAVDAQSTYESAMSLWAAVLAHSHLIYHGIGWLEGGLTASFEKCIVDAEMLQMLAESLRPLDLDDDAFGLDAMREVGPGGHFFGTAHTLERYTTAFYQPLLSDWSNFENWQDAGSHNATQRANTLWKALLADYSPPPLKPEVDEALRAYMAQRKQAILRAA